MTSRGSPPTGRRLSASGYPTVTEATPESRDWEQRLQAAQQQLRRGDVPSALREAEALAAGRPEATAPHYLLAVCYRYRKRYEDAASALDRLLGLSPGDGRAWQELGHLRRARGDVAGAIAAYRQALHYNPALLAAWKALAALLAREADGGDALEQARAQVAQLEALPRELLAASSKLHEGKLYQGERLCRAYLQQHPHHPEGMRLLALLGLELGVLDDAQFLLESCLELHPDFHRARFDLVQVLHRRQKYQQAREQASRLLELDADNPAYRVAYANESMALGDYDTALQVYDALMPIAPDPAGIQLARGHALKTRGDGEQAIAAYRAAYDLRADFGDAYWSLANLKTYRFSDTELAQMERAAEAEGTAVADRYHLCFALGKAHEDRDSHDAAFGWYQRGNALKRAELNYSATRNREETEAQIAHCDRELFERHAGSGCAEGDPIFIVGLPRSGSTLLEQILASHSQVDGTFELPNILAMAHRLGGRRKVGETSRYPAVLAELGADKLAALGEQYLRETAVYRQGAPFFTDKMPNNFRHIGLIHLLFPRARVIDARRHPMACCFSGFKQLFAEGQEFSYSLEDLGAYYRDYVSLMDHWDRVLPGRVHRVQHEALLADFEGELRRLLDYCGLPFEEQCLRFHDSRRAVRTASSEQVRQPLNRAGEDQWRHFAAHLDPLREALGPELLQRYPE